ncbi:MAG: DUF760 domain-containing protein [Oscillatoriales cyanobacterium SM2_2_1]|nr:DUF760 domain-containing protein [Oscillatoriales cyanobacterium SM2_2_1]
MQSNDNPLLSYLQKQSPDTLAQITQSVSPEVKQIVSQNIQNLLGMLPPSHFNVQIATDRENLAGLLGSAMMTGYFLSQVEMRMQLDQRLAAIGSLESDSELLP